MKKYAAFLWALLYVALSGAWFVGAGFPAAPAGNDAPVRPWHADWRVWVLMAGTVLGPALLIIPQWRELKRKEEGLRQRERTLQTSAAQSRAILENAADGIISADEYGVIHLFNPAAAQIFGYRASEIWGKNIKSLIPRPYLPEHESYRTRAALDGKPRVLSLGREVVGLRKDGTSFPVDLAVSEVGEGLDHIYIAIVRDITDRKEAEQELTQSREQLRSLAARLQTVREEERSRIAREIHDVLGQSLTGVKMDISWIAARLSKADLALQERARSMSELVDSTIQMVRKIATELRPGVLDNLGLVAALEWQAGEFESRTGIACRCQTAFDDQRLDPAQGTALFRIFQETLTNVARHAQASEVEARLVEQDHQIVLEVRDNGRGITPKELTANQSLGLLGIRERAAMLGGEVAIQGQAGHGTSVVTRIPRHRPGQPISVS